MNNTFKPYVTPVVLQNHLHLGGENAKGDSALPSTVFTLERQGRPGSGSWESFIISICQGGPENGALKDEGRRH